MTTKQKPATPLPWLCDPTGDCGPDWIGVDGHFVLEGTEHIKDAAYIAHAANAYPRLVEALREMQSRFATDESVIDIADDWLAADGKGAALLRELGED